MSIYIAHRSKNNASKAPNASITVQKETSSVYDENIAVNWHVRLTQIVFGHVPCRWFSDSVGATTVYIQLKPWNNE